jgi:hypothetical protein
VQTDVDTLRLRGRVKDASALRKLSEVRSRRVLDEQGESVRRDVTGQDVLRSGARVGVDLMHDGVPEAWVEFSAPKVGTGSNVVALPLREAVEVAREVYTEAGDLVQWADRFEHLRVQRIDLDRDFEDVSGQDSLLGALARVKAPYAPKTRLYPDSERSGATTLTRGPASRWLATLYSKEGEARHRHRYARGEAKVQAAADLARAEGRLRYELRLRSDVLGPRLRLVQDLEAEPLAQLCRGYFDRVGYGLEVTGMDVAASKIMAAEELRIDARMALAGWLWYQSQGIAPDLHRNAERKYRDRARGLGLTPADIEDRSLRETVALDFEAARLRRSA